MSVPNTERREEPRKRLTTRLLWHVISVSVVLLLATISLVFWNTYPSAKQSVVQQLQEQVGEKLRSNQAQLQAVEAQAELLSQAYLDRYQAFVGNPEIIGRFEKWFEETSPGVFRLQERFFSGTQIDDRLFRGLSVFVGPGPRPLSDEYKARLVISVIVLSEMAPAWRKQVTNTHFSFPENSLAEYSLDDPWGRQAAKDLVITDYSTVRSTLQHENPSRTPIWTGLYHDHSSGYWTITYQQPLDLHGQHLINTSFDVGLQQLNETLNQTEGENVETYVLNETGALVSSSTLIKKRPERQDTLTPETYDDPLYQEIAARLLQGDTVQGQQIWDDLDDDYLILVQHLGTPNWWYFSVYPKAMITSQALSLPLLIALIGVALVVAVLLTMTYFVRREVSRPLTQLAHVAALVDQKNYHEIEQQSVERMRGYGEVKQVLSAFRTMARRFVAANEQLEKRIDERTHDLRLANRKLDELAHLDGLTELLNRRSLQLDIDNVLANPDVSCFFVMADLDDFKGFNDNYGHEAGDRALIAIGQLFKSVEQSRTYRFGGEELAMLCRAETAAEVEERLQQLQQRIHKLAIDHTHSRRASKVLTASFGYTKIRPGETSRELIQRADKLLYKAKAQGGDCIIN
ncbi:Diguanylate cyclase VdcA [Pseudidiomarina piscicola]|uniref:diguanylate cyclase n=1 Tax=Pseudidiomarina piscicola TaxID=2614830 RepID=A0A6S6WKM5_9GAMM|nr:GGDEF domain-containing protein [Pseudidiomarina piscicola]CAB0151347.1 Diguanylate cyclase VdcA [Pseudidiomarina piscicola]VZT40828.1 Diguanylate cyclase VdcA [Pseudomonas aeruginosa]